MMKSKLLLLSVFALLASASAWADVEINVEINETTFPDENFRKWVLSQDYGADGVLTVAEIAGVKKIDVANKGIQNMKGIGIFTALTDLACNGNQLTTLNVSMNTKLKSLYCYDNQLTALDVSKNTALTDLFCINNQLTELDVSANTALTDLTCNTNQLTTLDVSKNTYLQNLSCSNNQLTELDVSKNIQLIYLRCYENQLTSLDVSKNTALFTLNCAFNPLTTLDVSKNTALTELWCNSNQLTSLDVSKNTALRLLSCNDNQLTTLDLSQNPSLIYLTIFANQILGAEMDALVESLPTVRSGMLFVIRGDNEQNVMTTVQVADAKAKGWTSYYCVRHHVLEDSWIDYMEYAGSDPNAIEEVTNSPSRNAEKYFDLQGRQLNGKPEKGVYIQNGKKFVNK